MKIVSMLLIAVVLVLGGFPAQQQANALNACNPQVQKC